MSNRHFNFENLFCKLLLKNNDFESTLLERLHSSPDHPEPANDFSTENFFAPKKVNWQVSHLQRQSSESTSIFAIIKNLVRRRVLSLSLSLLKSFLIGRI